MGNWTPTNRYKRDSSCSKWVYTSWVLFSRRVITLGSEWTSQKSIHFFSEILENKHWELLRQWKSSHSVLPDPFHPTDCGPPGSSVHGMLQARILEWDAIAFSRGSSQPRDQTQVSLTAGTFFTVWATREVMEYWEWSQIVLISRKVKIKVEIKESMKYMLSEWSIYSRQNDRMT